MKRSGIAVALWGEAGIGKTHHAKVLLRDAHCAHITVQATGTLAALARAMPRPKKRAAWTATLLEKLERGEFVAEDAAQDAIATTLSEIAPFIVHIEDLHEASPERLEWWSALAERVKGLRGVGLIVTSRCDPAAVFEAVRLEPLGLHETRGLLEAEIAAPLTPEAITWIQAKAAGNPLFTLEFFRHLARQGFAWNDGRRWYWREPVNESIPITIEAMIERLLSDATDTPELENVLAAAALLGADASTQWLAEVADIRLERTIAGISTLEAKGLLHASCFAHPLYREVAQARLSGASSRQLARRAIAWVRNTAPEQAIDFIQLAGLEPNQALELFDQAIAAQRAANRHVAAARLQHRSLGLRSGEERGQVALEALRVLHNVDFTCASALLEVALESASLSRSDRTVLIQHLAECRREADALGLVERLDESERSPQDWLEWRVRVSALAGNPRLTLELLDQHPELLHSSQPEVVQSLVQVLAIAGRSQEALKAGLWALKLDLNAEQRMALLQATGSACFFAGQYTEAIRVWSQAIDLARTNQAHTTAMKISINRAQALIRTGQKAQAETDLETGSKLARQFGDRRVYLQSLVLLGVTRTERGDFERAEQTLLEASAVFPEGVFADQRMNALMALTELYRVWPSPHAPILMHKYARQVVQSAQVIGNPIFELNARLALSGAELRIGNARVALQLADEALAMGRQNQQEFQTLSALRCRAAALEGLNDRRAALETWREATLVAEGLGLALLVQECRLEVDHLTSDAAAARQRLEWFEAEGHILEAAKARHYFPALQVHSKVPDARPVALSFEVLGALRLADGSAVRGRKRQELLSALLETRIAGKTEITRLELLDALYPDEDEDRAASSLKELVRSTRASLGPSAIQTTPNGYALGAVRSDAEDFLETGDTRLWRGAYLNGLNSIDDAVRESLHLALHLNAARQLETDPAEAARVGRVLLEFDPYNLEYLQLTLSALRASDNHKSLNRLYGAAKDRLLEVGETLPLSWQAFLESPAA